MNARSTSGATPTDEQRGIATPVERGIAPDAEGAPSPPTPLQSVTNPAIWMYRSDRFVFSWNAANGWEASYGFTTIQQMIDALSAAGHATRKINKLGICAHGDIGGRVHISSSTVLTADNVDYPEILSRLTQFGNFLTTNAQVIFYACAAGQGEEGARLLTRLSTLWPHRTIIGFTTYGFIATSFGAPNAPGNVYDTEQTAYGNAQTVGSRILSGHSAPRMDISGPSAKWARNGRIFIRPSIDSI
jgi:hypothetical protein